MCILLSTHARSSHLHIYAFTGIFKEKNKVGLFQVVLKKTPGLKNL